MSKAFTVDIIINMDNKNILINWGKDCLISKGCSTIKPPEAILLMPWSIVIRFSTVKGDFYLKQTPQAITNAI